MRRVPFVDLAIFIFVPTLHKTWIDEKVSEIDEQGRWRPSVFWRNDYKNSWFWFIEGIFVGPWIGLSHQWQAVNAIRGYHLEIIDRSIDNFLGNYRASHYIYLVDKHLPFKTKTENIIQLNTL